MQTAHEIVYLLGASRTEALEALVAKQAGEIEAMSYIAGAAMAERDKAMAELRELRMQMLSDEGQQRDIFPAPVDLMERVEKALEVVLGASPAMVNVGYDSEAGSYVYVRAVRTDGDEFKMVREALSDLRKARGKG